MCVLHFLQNSQKGHRNTEKKPANNKFYYIQKYFQVMSLLWVPPLSCSRHPCSRFVIGASCQWAWKPDEDSRVANEGCWQVIINVVPVALNSEGPCTSPSIILPTRSSCKCDVLSEGHPSAISNKASPPSLLIIDTSQGKPVREIRGTRRVGRALWGKLHRKKRLSIWVIARYVKKVNLKHW